MRRIDRSEVLGLGEYEAIREQFRARVIQEKRSRRVVVGEHLTAVFENILSGAANVGFLAHAALLEAELARPAVSAARTAEINRLIWNDRIDALMTAVFVLVVWIVLADSVRLWTRLLLGAEDRIAREEEAAA